MLNLKINFQIYVSKAHLSSEGNLGLEDQTQPVSAFDCVVQNLLVADEERPECLKTI